MIAIAIFVITAVVLPVAVAELTAWVPRWSHHIVERAARRLPAPHDERYAEEWAAHLDSVPGQLSKVVKALGMYAGSRDLRRSLPSTRDDESPRAIATSLPQARADIRFSVNGVQYMVYAKDGALTAADVIAAAGAAAGNGSSLFLINGGSQTALIPEDVVSGDDLNFVTVFPCEVGPDACPDADDSD